MTSNSKTVLIHYNGKWVKKGGNDEYDGTLQPAFVPDEYTIEDVKNQALGAVGFSHGPAFDLYGLLLVPATGLKMRFIITGEQVLKYYVSQVHGTTSFFIVPSAQVLKVVSPPTTPIGMILLPEVVTPLTPHCNGKVSSSEGDDFKNQPGNRDGTGGVAPPGHGNVRRCLIAAENLTAVKNYPQLHDADSTPHPEPASSLPLASNKVEYGNLCPGAHFKSKQQLHISLKIASIVGSFKYVAKPSNDKDLLASCKDPTCGWYVRASALKSLTWWVIKRTEPKHTCNKSKNKTDPKYAIKGMGRAMAKLFESEFGKCDSLYTPNDLRSDMLHKHGITISYKQGHTGCKRGTEATRGTTDESYQHLVSYSYVLEHNNPGTVTCIETNSMNEFVYYFMALGVCLDGFKNFSRTAISVDGTHLIGERAGVLLSAIALDSNEEIYPVAFGIVDSENDDSWDWFIKKLFDALGSEYLKKNPELVVVSDRSDHIHRAMTNRYPAVCHVFCAYHIKRNLLKKFHDGDAANLFIVAAKAYTPCHYNSAMKDFLKQSSAAVKYVQEIGEHRWSRVEAVRARFTLMTTNISECWNANVKKAKHLPITHLVDFIRRSLMEWFEELRETSLRWTPPLTPYAEKILEERWKLAKLFSACRIIGHKYEVIERGINDQHQVNISEKSCTCRVINYEHLPCPHVLAVCEKFKLDVLPLCGEYYQTWKWRSMYAPAIYPALSSEYWSIPESVAARIVLNPNTRRGKGRPKVDRIRCVSEKSRKLSKNRGCSNCHQTGHYATTCKAKKKK